LPPEYEVASRLQYNGTKHGLQNVIEKQSTLVVTHYILIQPSSSYNGRAFFMSKWQLIISCHFFVQPDWACCQPQVLGENKALARFEKTS